MTYEIRYTLELCRPAVLAILAGNPNLVQSQGYIPGSSVLGAAAAAFIRNGANGVVDRKAHHNKKFAHWFLRGGLRFLNAYPVDTENRRLLPVPLSLHSNKETRETVHDLSNEAVLSSVQADNARLVGIDGYGRIEGETLHTEGLQTRLRYHHWRPDRLKGRPAEGSGAVFVYEALEAGQKLGGRILGEKEALIQFLQATAWNSSRTTVWFGRSRTAEYGGEALLHLETPAPEPFTREVGNPTMSGQLVGERLVVTLLSPLIGRDEGGRPAAAFPLYDLQEALAGSGIQPVKIEKAYCRALLLGGYSGIWNMPRPQCQALAAGSVVVISTQGKPAPGFKLADAEERSLGLRIGEGFGRFALNWHSFLDVESREAAKLWSPLSGKVEGDPPSGFVLIYAEARKRLVEDALRSRGIEHGSAVTPLSPTEGVSASQLGRVNHTLHGTGGLTRLIELLARLRQPAREQLSKSRLNGDTLLEVLESYSANPRQVSSLFDVPRPGGINGLAEDDELGLIDEEGARLYLLSLCTQLARRKRPGGQTGGEANGNR